MTRGQEIWFGVAIVGVLFGAVSGNVLFGALWLGVAFALEIRAKD